jgi:hypothetical protein
MERGEKTRRMSWSEARATLGNAEASPEVIEKARQQWVAEFGEDEK